MPTRGELTIRCPYCSAYPAPFEGQQSFQTEGRDGLPRVWYMAFCPACGAAVVMELDPADGNTVMKVYPESVGEWQVGHLPDGVKAEWDEAISVFRVGAHPSAVVACGRCLEAGAEELDVGGRTLDERIRNMRNLGLIADQFKEAMTYVRLIRNIGAHTGQKVSPETAEGAMRFTQQALRLLFEVPGELKRLTRPPELDQPAAAEPGKDAHT